MNKWVENLANQAWNQMIASANMPQDPYGIPYEIPDAFCEALAKLVAEECIVRAEQYGLSCDAVSQLMEDFNLIEIE